MRQFTVGGCSFLPKFIHFVYISFFFITIKAPLLIKFNLWFSYVSHLHTKSSITQTCTMGHIKDFLLGVLEDYIKHRILVCLLCLLKAQVFCYSDIQFYSNTLPKSTGLEVYAVSLEKLGCISSCFLYVLVFKHSCHK